MKTTRDVRVAQVTTYTFRLDGQRVKVVFSSDGVTATVMGADGVARTMSKEQAEMRMAGLRLGGWVETTEESEAPIWSV